MSMLMQLAVLCCLAITTMAQAQTVQPINFVTNHILYEPVSGKIYASIPSSAGSNGNSVATIDPMTTSNGTQDVTVTAAYGTQFIACSLQVVSSVSALVLSKLTISPSAVGGGESATGTVQLSNVAPVGGIVVNLVSSNPNVVSAPSSVTVPVGAEPV